MMSVKSRNSTYIKNKLDEMIVRFGTENIKRYVDYYEAFPDNLESLLSLLHYEFNRLFKYMNSRLSNGHYNADESRDLIYLSEELKTIQSNTRGTEYAFDLTPYYGACSQAP